MNSHATARRRALPWVAVFAALGLCGSVAQAFWPPINPDPPPHYVPPPIHHTPPPPPPVQPPPDNHNPPPVHSTPEPGTMVLGMIGGAIACIAARKKKSAMQ